MSRRKPSYLSLTDLFCGAGGASIGAELAGVKLVLGVNHWDRAIATHSTNFPNAAHDCRDVSETHPSRYGSTHLLWASPECPTWSQARGKRADQGITGQLGLNEEFEPLPTAAEVKSRVTMWDVVRYAEFHDYEAVVVENVVDVMRWSLLPVWYQAMEALGYAHRTLFLNSMFFGVPQSRDRWYVVFWKRANRTPDLDFTPAAWCPMCEATVEARQSFKKPKRWTDRYGRQYLYLCPACASTALPFVTPALEAIDWGVLGERIGDRKDPLAPATMARIQAGIDRYWNRPVVFDELRDAKHRDALSAPLATQTGRQSQALYIPLLAHLRGTSDSSLNVSTRRIDQPMGTVTAGNHHALIRALYVKQFRGGAEMSRPVEEPLGSITAIDHHALVMTNQHDNRARAADAEPLPTQTTGTTTGLVVPINGGRHGDGGHKVRSTAEPLLTQTGDLYRALLTSYYGRPQTTRPAAEPMATVPTEPRHGLLVPMDQRGPNRHNRSRTVEDPLRTQTSIQADALVTAYYGGSNVNRSISEPMPTHRAVESHALVERGGEPVLIEDCSFRMLMPAEIGRGMAFHDAYEVLGNQRERVQQYGQAVTPPIACWLLQRVVGSLS